MADIQLKYLTDLTSATAAGSEDLIHINQSGNDRSITLTILLESMINGIYPKGITIWFNSSANPNVLFPGTVWARIAGYGRTVRIANSSGSDVGVVGGADSIALSVNNLPPHNHTFAGETEAFDYGTKTTNSSGAHTHQLNTQGVAADQVGVEQGALHSGSGKISSGTTSDGSHTHTTAIGSHKHTFSGSTEDAGSSAQVDITNKYINQAAWYRTA